MNGFELHNEEAEQALLGAVLTNTQCMDSLSDVKPDHFYFPVHGRIFDALLQADTKGEPCSPITLSRDFKDDPELAEVGSDKYLARLARNAVTLTQVGHYGKIVTDLFTRRQLETTLQKAIEDNRKAPVQQSGLSLVEQTEAALFGLTETSGGQTYTTFADASLEALQRAEAAFKADGDVSGLSTGFKALDRQTAGLHNSDLYIIAGRPAMGKTALATNIAFNVARGGTPVAFFSLEMSSDQLAARILASQAGVNGVTMRQGLLHVSEMERVIAVQNQLADLPIIIDDTGQLEIGVARSRARRLKRKFGIGLIVFDYIGLARGTKRNRVDEVAEITGTLKAMAKDLDIPVIGLSQVNRGVEQREDKRPLLSDLRESGSIEQDADAVMFVYREEYYAKDKEPQNPDKRAAWQDEMNNVRGQAEVIIAKQRQGAIGTVKMRFNAAKTQFGDI